MSYSLKPYTLFILCIVVLSSCGSYQTNPSPSVYYTNNQATDKLKKSESGLKDEEGFKIDRKIIKDADIQLKVLEPDSIFNDLAVIARLSEGYISTSSSSYAKLTVKAENLEDALKMIAKLGKVQSQNTNTRDVTASYTDFKVRLENAEKSRNRYLALMKKAERVSDILPIEKELERLTEKIERIKGQLHVMEHQIAYSRIDVYWQKKTKPGPIGYVFVGLYKAVKVLFVR